MVERGWLLEVHYGGEFMDRTIGRIYRGGKLELIEISSATLKYSELVVKLQGQVGFSIDHFIYYKPPYAKDESYGIESVSSEEDF